MESWKEALDPSSPLPLYRQLADRLLNGIRAGDISSGAKLPSEPALARHYGVGRPTVRQATDVLVRRKFVERKRGSGTFVVDSADRVDLLSLAGTMASFEKGGVEVEIDVTAGPIRVLVPETSENTFRGHSAVFVSRLSRVRGVPVLLEEIYADADRFPALEDADLAGRSVSQWIDSHYHMTPISADQNFRVFALDAARAKQLGMEEGEPILLVNRTLHFRQAKNAIQAILYCRTEELVFSQTLEGQSHE